MTILDAMSDRNLFGRWFSGRSWDAWRVFLAALFGLPMTAEQLAVYQRHTGRTTPTGPHREAWVIAGRRAGKSRIAALVAVYLATMKDWSAHLAPGEVPTIMVLAASRAQARVIFRYARALIVNVPALRPLLPPDGETKESLTLTNGAVIEVHAVSQARSRGYTLAAVLADECCFWAEGPDGENAADTIAALRPALSTLPGAMLLAISSPWAKRGIAYTQTVKHHANEGSPVLSWVSDTVSLNPKFDAQTIADAMEADPISARTEYGWAAWRDDVSSFLSREQLFATVVDGRTALPPETGRQYVAGFDAAAGSGKDSATLAVAHAEDGRAVLDLVVERRPPFSPPSVTAEFAAILHEYGVRTIEADRFGGDWVTSAFAKHHVTVEHCRRSRSECYLELLPSITAQRVELLDDERMLAQFLALERRAGRTRDIVDHPPGAAHHDDCANSAAIALLRALDDGAGAFVSPDVTLTRVSPWLDGASAIGGDRW